MRPSRTAVATRRFSAESFAELRLPASTPKWRSASTWSRIRAISGETTSGEAVPGEGRKLEQSDLPAPVGMIASTSSPAITAATISSWPAR